jgi:uncharacterized protein YkuJ
MAYLRESSDNKVTRAIAAVEECMEKNGVSVYKAMGGDTFISVKYGEKQMYFKLIDPETREPVNVFPRPFDNIRLQVL